ncbi:hypothetical protein KIH86_17660 [Paenibacillus sp. HN-1]|uniref:phage tail terminator family protein n=1 Tax=Paenibacillus TaxID=44249 RepID=UPI001CA9C91A|nr:MULTISPECIES: hypothetical protein [Paenibacillus]MBY9078304.1 hypothetical protein [Paenibacillus sp. CGMCC 1.18879]MBY9086037.1 hypothetical protein [Paenibacillus sinensis]
MAEQVSFMDVRNAVTTALDTAFPAIPIRGEEIKQNLITPCFFVRLLEAEQSREVNLRYRRVHSFDIHYFPTDSPAMNEEMQTIAERLYDVMEYVSSAAGGCRGTGMRHETQDGVLHFFVQYNFHVFRELTAEVKMQRMTERGGLK